MMKPAKILCFIYFFLINWNLHSQGFAEFAVDFDHTTATYNRITPSLGFMCVNTAAAYDHQGNRLWFNSIPTCGLIADVDLFCIDTQTGNTLNFFPSYLIGPEFVAPMVYDNSTDTLYGIYQTGYWPSDPYLAWIEPSTGAVNIKVPLPYANGITDSELTLDEENHRLIFLAPQDTFGVYYRLYTIDVRSGALIHQPFLTSSLGLLKIANLTYNHSDDKLYGVIDSATWTHSRLQTFDLATGERTTVAFLPKRHIVSRNTCALDEASNHFIYVSQYPDPDTIYTVDINTQSIIHRIAYPYDPSGGSDTIENVLNYFYDPSEQTIFAIHYGKLDEQKPAGMDEIDKDFSIYPNPSSGKFSVAAVSKIDWVEIVNEMGQVLDRFYPENEQLNLDLSHHPSGIYWIRIQSENKISTQKLVIQ